MQLKIRKNKTDEEKQITINGVGAKYLENNKADRLQLFFDGKPPQEVINLLKRNAFKWSPTNGCWQRKITANAKCAIRSMA